MNTTIHESKSSQLVINNPSLHESSISFSKLSERIQITDVEKIKLFLGFGYFLATSVVTLFLVL